MKRKQSIKQIIEMTIVLQQESGVGQNFIDQNSFVQYAADSLFSMYLQRIVWSGKRPLLSKGHGFKSPYGH